MLSTARAITRANTKAITSKRPLYPQTKYAALGAERKVRQSVGT